MLDEIVAFMFAMSTHTHKEEGGSYREEVAKASSAQYLAAIGPYLRTAGLFGTLSSISISFLMLMHSR